jgi:hypothetical protein
MGLGHEPQFRGAISLQNDLARKNWGVVAAKPGGRAGWLLYDAVKSRKVKTNRNTVQSTATGRASLI